MSKNDPVDRNLVRMELRRFQTRCDAQEGAIRRADSVHEVARLTNVILPYILSEETQALDARRQLRQAADERARDLFERLLDRLVKAEPFARDKLRRSVNEEVLQFIGPLSSLRPWACNRLSVVEQTIRD